MERQPRSSDRRGVRGGGSGAVPAEASGLPGRFMTVYAYTTSVGSLLAP
jgi:hypothetical protein